MLKVNFTRIKSTRVISNDNRQRTFTVDTQQNS